MKKKYKKYLPYLLFLLLTIFYFEYSVTITWDSAHYMSYVSIFEGLLPVNTWDVVRGPVFPLIIYIGNILFSKTTTGLLMNTYIYYLIMLIFTYKVLKVFLDDLNINDSKKNVILWIVMLLTIINPIIYGYYHALLTEFVAITIVSISCYISYLWLNIDTIKNKKQNILYTIIFVIITIISWFLKQPYVSCSFFVIFVAYLISIIQNHKINNILRRTCTIFICLICLFISMKSWNAILKVMGNDPTTDRNPTKSLGNQLIMAIDFIEIDNNSNLIDNNYINNTKLSDKEKNNAIKLIENKKDITIINYKDKDKIIDADYIVTNEGNISTFTAIKYILKVFIHYPFKLISAYITNYLSIIDIYSTNSDNGVSYYSNKKIDLKFSNEINSIGYKPYYYGMSNTFYMLPEMQERVTCYEQTNNTFIPFNYVMLILGKIYLVVFKIIFVLLPISLIYAIYLRISKKVELNDKLNLIIIMLGFSFLHLLLHTVTGAIIDRYAVPAIISTINGLIMLTIIITIKKKPKRVK